MSKDLKKIIKNSLIEESINLINDKIYKSINPYDKKELYRLVKNSNVEEVKKKMIDIMNKLEKILGEENKGHIRQFMKKMVYKMYITKN